MGLARMVSRWRVFDDPMARYGTAFSLPATKSAFYMSVTTLDGSLHRGCGGRYALQSEAVTVRVSGMAADVERSFYRCEKCNHEQRTIDQRDSAEKSAIERIRLEYDLLTPRAIRNLREGLGLTVPQMADLCYGTPKGIVEGWEKGALPAKQRSRHLAAQFGRPRHTGTFAPLSRAWCCRYSARTVPSARPATSPPPHPRECIGGDRNVIADSSGTGRWWRSTTSPSASTLGSRGWSVPTALEKAP